MSPSRPDDGDSRIESPLRILAIGTLPVREINGLTIAFLAFSMEGFASASNHSPGVARLDPILTTTAITGTRKSAVPVIPNLHDDSEYCAAPGPGMPQSYPFLANSSVDAKSGSHQQTHALQNFSSGRARHDLPCAILKMELADQSPDSDTDQECRGLMTTWIRSPAR